MGSAPRPSTIRARQKLLLVNGRQYLRCASLERPISNARNAQWALLLLTGFRDIHSPDVRRSIPLPVNRLKHRFNPLPEALLRLGHRLAVYARSRSVRNMTKAFPYPLPCNVMRQRGKPKGWLHRAFAAIRSSPVSMVGVSSLCIEGLISHCMEPMLSSNNSTSAGRFPMWPALPTSEYYQPV
jgi:hypothetical protein